QVQAALLALGVPTIAVHGFSMNNFKRSEDQQRHLFHIISRTCQSICGNWEFYRNKKWKLKLPGALDLFPEELHKLTAKVELLTHQERPEAQIFYCGPYGSKTQMTRMALTLCHAVRDGLLEPSDITERLIDRYHEIQDGPPVEFFLRTSGENRLSDFLTWQSERALFYFEPKNFPDIVVWDMFKMLLFYSASLSSRKRLEDGYLRTRKQKEVPRSAEQRLKERKFQSWLETKRQAYLRRLAGDDL
ncbi:unnamed protein product, partial [Ixodes hexagonus]